jgi:dTDP-4-dehydrorhamnose reductase
VSAYKYSKLFSEAIVEKTSNSPLIVRCSSLLGEAMRYNTLMKIINDETSEITLTKDSTYNFIRHSDLLEFILKAAKKDVTGVVDFVASDYIELKEVVDRLNSSVAYGSYTFKTPNASNARLVNMFPEYNKSSWEALGEFLEEIK